MEYHTWINTALGLLSPFLAFLLYRLTTGKQNSDRFAKMELQVDTMWSAFLASGVTKGEIKGLLSSNSPVRLLGDTPLIMESLKNQLREFRKTECPDCDEPTLALLIAKKFKEDIIKICVPNNIQFEVGILIATAVAKSDSNLTEILDDYHIPRKEQKI